MRKEHINKEINEVNYKIFLKNYFMVCIYFEQNIEHVLDFYLTLSVAEEPRYEKTQKTQTQQVQQDKKGSMK